MKSDLIRFIAEGDARKGVDTFFDLTGPETLPYTPAFNMLV